MLSRRFSGFVLLASLAAAGCGNETSTVSGLIRYKGKPVPGGSVIFYCPDKQIVRGIVEPDGRYLMANVPFGKALVTVQTHPRIPNGLKLNNTLPRAVNGPTLPTTDEPEKRPLPIPARYSQPEDSGLSVVIDREQVIFDIELMP
jgi:hypothetical protein